MTELWVPGTTLNPDPNNLFDMMEIFQSEIDRESSRQRQINTAILAARSLAATLEKLSPEDKAVSLVAQFAIIDSMEHADSYMVVENVGMIGGIKDINCVSLGERLPLSISLNLDIEYLFPPSNPDDADLRLSTGNVPINRVSYIEQDA